MAVRRTRAEPRRLSNAWWLLATVVLSLNTVAYFSVPAGALVLISSGLLLVLCPLLVLALLVFLLLNGVVMLRREGRSLGNLLSLLLGLALLLLCLTPLAVLASDEPVVLAVVLGLLLAGYFGFLFVGYLGYSWLYPRLVRARPADWVVVLGSGLGQGSRVTPLLAARIRTGITQAVARQARVLVMSGGKGDDEQLPEAEAMGRWALAEGGLDPALGGPQLELERRSRSTVENLRFSAELLGRRPELMTGGAPGAPGLVAPGQTGEAPPPPALAEGLLVTSSYHVLRAAMLARRLGVPAQAVGAPTAGYFWPSAVLREFVAVLSERRWVHLVLSLLVALPVPVLVLARG